MLIYPILLPLSQGLLNLMLQASTPTGCTMTKKVEVIVNLPETPSICMVSVDNTTKNNILYWKHLLQAALIQYLYIGRLISLMSIIRSGVWELIVQALLLISYFSCRYNPTNMCLLFWIRGNTSAYSIPHIPYIFLLTRARIITGT